MAESLSRQKSRHTPQKEGGLTRLVRPLMSRMDGKKTHTHPIIWTFSLYINSGCGKREEHNNNIWSMVMQGQHPLLELP